MDILINKIVKNRSVFFTEIDRANMCKTCKNRMAYDLIINILTKEKSESLNS